MTPSSSYQSLLSVRSNKKPDVKISNISGASKKREKKISEESIPARDTQKSNPDLLNPKKKMRTNFDIFKEIYMNENTQIYNNYQTEKKINS